MKKPPPPSASFPKSWSRVAGASVVGAEGGSSMKAACVLGPSTGVPRVGPTFTLPPGVSALTNLG